MLPIFNGVGDDSVKLVYSLFSKVYYQNFEQHILEILNVDITMVTSAPSSNEKILLRPFPQKYPPDPLEESHI